MALDKQAVAGATRKNLAGQALADELAKAVRTPQDLKKLDLAQAMRVRNVVTFGATGLAGVLMVLNFGKLLDDVEKGMSHELAEATAKLMAGKVAVAGFVADVMGKALDKVGEPRLRNMMGRAGAMAPRALQIGRAFAGFGVGIFLGLWDISKGLDSAKQEDHGLAVGYFTAGAAGIVVATAMFGVAMGALTLGPVGWLLLAVGILIWLGAALFVEMSKDSPLQEWLARCHFGTASDKYADTAAHIAEYKLALSK